MKRLLLPAAVTATLLPITGCTVAPGVDVDAEKSRISSVVLQAYTGIEHQNWPELGQLVVEDWSLYTMGQRQDLPTVRDFFAQHITDQSISVTDLDIRVSGDGSLAWASFKEQSEYHFDGDPVRETALGTALLQREFDEWKMVNLIRSAASAPSQFEVEPNSRIRYRVTVQSGEFVIKLDSQVMLRATSSTENHDQWFFRQLTPGLHTLTLTARKLDGQPFSVMCDLEVVAPGADPTFRGPYSYQGGANADADGDTIYFEARESTGE